MDTKEMTLRDLENLLKTEYSRYCSAEKNNGPVWRWAIASSQFGSLAAHLIHDPNINPGARPYGTTEGETLDFGHAVLQLMIYGVSKGIPIPGAIAMALNAITCDDWKEKEPGKLLSGGDMACSGIASGFVFLSPACDDLDDMPHGSILVASHPDDIIILKILKPLSTPQISLGSPFNAGFTEAYKKQFLSLTPPRKDGKHSTYTYWNRHEDYPCVYPIMKTNDFVKVCGDGTGDGLKQISSIIKKLSEDSRTRRAVSVTWNPALDMDNNDPPCMLFIQVVIRNDKVNLRTLFRSQDMLLGLPQNLIGCAALLEYITNEVNHHSYNHYEPGVLILISTIPHIYHIRDANYLDQMKQEINRKKTFGLWRPIISG